MRAYNIPRLMRVYDIPGMRVCDKPTKRIRRNRGDEAVWSILMMGRGACFAGF